MKRKMYVSRDVQHEIADILGRDPWFAERRCEIIEQNEQRLSFMIRKKMAEYRGPVVVVAVDGMRNSYPGVEVDLTVNVTELVPINRGVGMFATAIEVGEAVVDAIDGEVWHWQDLRHETPGNGVLTCAVKFSGMVGRECDDDQDCGE